MYSTHNKAVREDCAAFLQALTLADSTPEVMKADIAVAASLLHADTTALQVLSASLETIKTMRSTKSVDGYALTAALAGVACWATPAYRGADCACHQKGAVRHVG